MPDGRGFIVNTAHEAVLELRGPCSGAAAATLARRLNELGHTARFEENLVFLWRVDKPRECLDYELGPYDPPEFSAEKILDDLAARGWIALDMPEWSASEEAGIRDRLKGLGYVE